MKFMKVAALVFLIVIVFTIGLYTLATPLQEPHSAAEKDVESRIWDAESNFPTLEFSSVEVIGSRVIIDANYTGGNEVLGQTEWYDMAHDVANTIYHEFALNRGVEIRIYQDSQLRGEASAGL